MVFTLVYKLEEYESKINNIKYRIQDEIEKIKENKKLEKISTKEIEKNKYETKYINSNDDLATINLDFNEKSIIQLEQLDEIEQKEILDNYINSKVTRNSIITELRNLKINEAEQIILKSKSYKRDNKTIAQIKFLRNFQCQICSQKIKKKDGTFYIEAAHIEPKKHKGIESPNNIILLCPNHHKEFDLGERQIIQHDNDKVIFILNNQKFEISLKLE